MKKTILIVLIILLCSMSIAFGYVIGSSNFPLADYPAFRGYPPSKPYSRDSFAMSSYRSEVESYVDSANRYVEACKNDIQRIIESAEKAKRDANNAIEEYNSFIKFGI